MATKIPSEPEVLGLNDADWSAFGPGRGAVVSTGFGSEHATDLLVVHAGGFTYVSPGGEHQNCDPWKYQGIHPTRHVLKWYRDAVKDDDDGDAW